MFSKPHRIPSVLISTIMRTGKRTIAGCLQCTTANAKNSIAWRCAVVVPTSTDKRAVVRNRIKRLISESITRLSPELPAGMDFVFFVKKGFEYASQKQANDQVHTLLQKIGYTQVL